MVDFRHLDTPRPAGNDGKWVVLAAKDRFLVLLKTGELEYGPDYKTEEYQFEYELDAHFAAKDYYNQNQQRGYPHIDAMLNSTAAYPLVFDDDDFIDDDQKSMEFI